MLAFSTLVGCGSDHKLLPHLRQEWPVATAHLSDTVDRVSSLDYSPASGMVAIGQQSGSISIHRASDLKVETSRIRGRDDIAIDQQGVGPLTFSHRGDRLAIQEITGDPIVYDLQLNVITHLQMSDEESKCKAFLWTTDDRQIIGVINSHWQSCRIIRWDAATGRRIAEGNDPTWHWDGGGGTHIVDLPNGHFAVACYSEVREFSNDLKVLRSYTLEQKLAPVRALRRVRDRNTFYIDTNDGTFAAAGYDPKEASQPLKRDWHGSLEWDCIGENANNGRVVASTQFEPDSLLVRVRLEDFDITSVVQTGETLLSARGVYGAFWETPDTFAVYIYNEYENEACEIRKVRVHCDLGSLTWPRPDLPSTPARVRRRSAPTLPTTEHDLFGNNEPEPPTTRLAD